MKHKVADQLIAFYFNNKRPISLAISTDVINRENSGDVVKRVYTNGGGFCHILTHIRQDGDQIMRERSLKQVIQQP